MSTYLSIYLPIYPPTHLSVSLSLYIYIDEKLHSENFLFTSFLFFSFCFFLFPQIRSSARRHRAALVWRGFAPALGPGEWFGLEIETDAFPAGRHDGAVLGFRYFNCPPRRGLLVRASVLSPPQAWPTPPIGPPGPRVNPAARAAADSGVVAAAAAAIPEGRPAAAATAIPGRGAAARAAAATAAAAIPEGAASEGPASAAEGGHTVGGDPTAQASVVGSHRAALRTMQVGTNRRIHQGYFRDVFPTVIYALGYRRQWGEINLYLRVKRLPGDNPNPPAGPILDPTVVLC